MSIEGAICLLPKKLDRKVGRTDVTGWVRKCDLGVKAVGKYGHWLVRSDLFENYLSDTSTKPR